jgi:hypothetical protein
MEQRAVIRFSTLKGMKARAVHTKLESAYCPKVFPLLMVKKWRRRFHPRRTDLFFIRSLDQ